MIIAAMKPLISSWSIVTKPLFLIDLGDRAHAVKNARRCRLLRLRARNLE